MSITSDQVATLLEWCAVNAILIDEQVCLSVGSEEHDGLSIGLGVYSADAFIPPHTTRQSTPNGLRCGTSGLTHTVSNGLFVCSRENSKGRGPLCQNVFPSTIHFFCSLWSGRAAFVVPCVIRGDVRSSLDSSRYLMIIFRHLA